MTYTFFLAFPPTVNNYYQTGQGRSRFISGPARKYREESVSSAHHQNMSLLLAGRLKVKVILYPPDKRTRDLDNYMKGLLDACTHAGVWVDDAQIDELLIIRGEVRVKRPGAEIWVEEVG